MDVQVEGNDLMRAYYRQWLAEHPGPITYRKIQRMIDSWDSMWLRIKGTPSYSIRVNGRLIVKDGKAVPN